MNHQFERDDEQSASYCEIADFLSEARYQAIVEAQSELICRFRSDGTLTFVNLTYCQRFGKQRRELIGENVLRLIPQSERETVQQHWRSLNPDNPARTYEHPIIAPTGEMPSYQWSTRAIFDPQGRLLEFQSVGREIALAQPSNSDQLSGNSERGKGWGFLPYLKPTTHRSGGLLRWGDGGTGRRGDGE
ncbi:MAG TPA: PAS domain-containing protein, partial [Allocoleopsis sp.]